MTYPNHHREEMVNMVFKNGPLHLSFFRKEIKRGSVVQSNDIISTVIPFDITEEPTVPPQYLVPWSHKVANACFSFSLTALLILFFWLLPACPQTKCQCSPGLDSCLPPLRLHTLLSKLAHPKNTPACPPHSCPFRMHDPQPFLCSPSVPLLPELCF